MVPSDGDPSVSVILLWGSDRLPIPAAACFSVSQSFGCGDLSTRCWFSKQDPIQCSSVPHSCPRLPRYACMHMCARDACCIYVSAYICMSAHVCKFKCLCMLHWWGTLRAWLPPDVAPYLLITPSGLIPVAPPVALLSLNLMFCPTDPSPMAGFST